DVDLHLDFADDADRLLVGEVTDRTMRRDWHGRVCVGHMTALGALMPEELAPVVARIRDAGISILVLPATDLYLMGRHDVKNVRRGLAPARRLHDAGVNVAPTSSRPPDTSGPWTTSCSSCAWRRTMAPGRCGSPTTACARARAPIWWCSIARSPRKL